MTPRSDPLLVSSRDDASYEALIVIRRAAAHLADAYPFHAALLSRWVVVVNRSVATAAVTARLDAVYVVFNVDFVLSISADELRGVLHHELNHVLFGHIFVPPDRFPDHWARIVSTEVTVNEWVSEPLPGAPIVLALYPELPPGEDTDTRYERLAGTVPDAPEPLDDHDAWEGARADGAGAMLAATVSVHAAAMQAPGAFGLLPGAVRELVVRVHGDRPGADLTALLGTGTPSLDWRGTLSRLVASELVVAPRYGRPPRRYPHLVGVVPGRARVAARHRVMAVVDTSGSIDDLTLEDVAGELNAMSRWASITVVECDAAIHRVYSFSRKLDEVHGRNGTDLRPPFEPLFLREHRPDAIVYFTDGFGPAPEVGPRVPVWWCLTAEGERPAPWGRELRRSR